MNAPDVDATLPQQRHTFEFERYTWGNVRMHGGAHMRARARTHTHSHSATHACTHTSTHAATQPRSHTATHVHRRATTHQCTNAPMHTQAPTHTPMHRPCACVPVHLCNATTHTCRRACRTCGALLKSTIALLSQKTYFVRVRACVRACVHHAYIMRVSCMCACMRMGVRVRGQAGGHVSR